MSGTQYIYLKGIKGLQTVPYKPEYYFSWDVSQEDGTAHYFWIYKEDEKKPQMIPYSNCISHQITVSFKSNQVPLTDIRKVKFLVFISERAVEPSKEEITLMASKKEYICEVCCGAGDVKWYWEKNKNGNQLVIESEKNISEGLLYYGYPYGANGIPLEFEIPGEIKIGKTVFEQMNFPELSLEPELRARGENIRLVKKKKFRLFWSAGYHK